MHGTNTVKSVAIVDMGSTDCHTCRSCWCGRCNWPQSAEGKQRASKAYKLPGMRQEQNIHHSFSSLPASALQLLSRLGRCHSSAHRFSARSFTRSEKCFHCPAMAAMYWLVVASPFFLSALHVAHAADPDPLQDICVADLESTIIVNGFPCLPRDKVTAKDFTYTGFRKAVNPTSVSETGATADLASVSQLPGLNTMGVMHARLDFAVGGVIPLHTHPRAAETLFVVKGSVYTGFIDKNNVLYASTLEAGDFTVFPRALLHFQLNVGNESAITFNTLTSQAPGILVTANQVFVPNVTNVVIEKSFGIDSSTVKQLRSGIPRYWG